MAASAIHRAQQSLALLEALQSARHSHQGDYTLQEILADTIDDLQALSFVGPAADRPQLGSHLTQLEQLYHSLIDLTASLESAATWSQVCYALRLATETILILYSRRS